MFELQKTEIQVASVMQYLWVFERVGAALFQVDHETQPRQMQNLGVAVKQSALICLGHKFKQEPHVLYE